MPLTVGQAAKILGLPQQRVRDQLAAGTLPGVKRHGRWRIPQETLVAATPRPEVALSVRRMTESPRWEQTLTRRVRSLVRTAPLHRIEAGKAMRARDLASHDLRALALRVIDAVIEHMGLGYGARRRELIDVLAPMIRATEPDATAHDVAEITNLIVDHLLNDADRRLQFEEPYVSFEPGGATPRAVRFHLLREEEADDGTIVLKATTEAINLYAGMLDVDVEDAQTAAEAVLQAQIQRGAIGAAVATARQARLRSIEYAETVRSTIRQVRRDVTKVDPRSLLQTVKAARAHLDERLRVERGLLEAVDERISTANAEDAPALVELHDVLHDCRQRHLALHTELIGVHDDWLKEQERQRFRARASVLPELERDVLGPLLAATLGEIEPFLDVLLLPFHAPAAPPVLDLPGLVDTLLAPRRRDAEAVLNPEPVHLDPIAAIEARFDVSVVARVAELLAVGGLLSALLASSRDTHDPPAVRRLLVLRALWAYDHGSDPLLRAVEPSAMMASDPTRALTFVQGTGRLDDPEYQGVDLHVGPHPGGA